MNDDQVRTLLEGAVAEVEPRPALDRIRARTAHRVRGGRWLLAVGGAVAATAATLATAGVLAVRHDDTGAASQGGAHTSQVTAPRHRGVSDADGSMTITSPWDGATVVSPFAVSGRAATFEGTVQWELRRGTTVVKRGFTTARECCTLSPYSFRVTAPKGDYTLVVHDEDVSHSEGGPPAKVTERVTVR